MKTQPEQQKPKAVILLSGGLDSYTTAALAKQSGYDCYALTVDYGQRHRYELNAAKKIAHALKLAQHKIISLDLRLFGGSALTDNLPVPKDKSPNQPGIPITYVPARNTIFLALALAWAETLQAKDLFIGVNAVDYSGYPDCRPEFINAFQIMANLATKAAVQNKQKYKIHTPIINLSKEQIIRKGTDLHLDYSLSSSCYDPDPTGRACGHCDSCQLRKQGFQKARVKDPTIYAD